MDAGYDLFSAVNTFVPARGRQLDLGIAVAVPIGTYGRIAPRSGLGWKKGIDIGAGVVDGGYRGGVKALVFNHDDEDFVIASGDCVAQLILECIVTPEYRCCGSDDVAAELHFTRTEIDPRAYGTVAHVVVEIRRRCRTLTIAVCTLLPEGLHDRTDYIQDVTAKSMFSWANLEMDANESGLTVYWMFTSPNTYLYVDVRVDIRDWAS